MLLTTPATGSAERGIVNIDSVRGVDVQAQYRAAAGTVEQEGTCQHLDLYQAWRVAVGPGWESAHEAGWMYDALHPTQRGHDDIATRVCALLGLRHS